MVGRGAHNDFNVTSHGNIGVRDVEVTTIGYIFFKNLIVDRQSADTRLFFNNGNHIHRDLHFNIRTTYFVQLTTKYIDFQIGYQNSIIYQIVVTLNMLLVAQ